MIDGCLESAPELVYGYVTRAPSDLANHNNLSRQAELVNKSCEVPGANFYKVKGFW